MNFLPEQLEEYVVAHSQQEPELLQELARETWQKVLAPRMLSGHYQGRVLSMISKLVNPKHILEIGTYTGYSALCLAEGLQKNGSLHTIDNNEELYNFQRKYFDKSDFATQIIQHTGTALEIIPTLRVNFNLVFMDADKVNYPNYFNLIMSTLKSGAVILSDNVLWTGKVIQQLKPDDKDTEAILKYNNMLVEDKRVESVLLPIRDGLTVTRVV